MICWSMQTARRSASTRPTRWDAPLAAHGMMHMVITNAAKGDPYPDRRAVHVHGQHELELGDECAGHARGISRRRTRRRRVRHPAASSTPMPMPPRWSHYADLILPDTTYLERWDCISLLDRPISEADGPADSIRQPVVEPDRDVRPFQEVLLDLGARLGLPGMATHRWHAALSRRLSRLHRQPRTRAGPWAARRLPRPGRQGARAGARSIPNQLEHYIDNGCHWFYELPDHMKYYKHVNWAYLDWATFMGFLGKPEPIIHQLYLRAAAEIPAGGAGPRQGRCRPPSTAQRIETYFDPIPFWYPPFEGEHGERATNFPCTRSRSGRWPCITPGARRTPGCARSSAATGSTCTRARGRARHRRWRLGDRHLASRPRSSARRSSWMASIRDTVWTWNAIGKRSGAWGLDAGCAGSQKGLPAQSLDLANFCRNVKAATATPTAIRSPGRRRGTISACASRRRRTRRRRASRSSPALKNAEEGEMTSLPASPAQRNSASSSISTPASAARPAPRPARNGTRKAIRRRSPTTSPYGADPMRRLAQPRPRLRGEGAGQGPARIVHFPRSCLHCETPACVTVCPTGASYKRAEDGIVLVNPDTCIGCKLCSWACPYGAREYDYAHGVMKKCTLCVDRIYNENFEPEDRVAGLREGLPDRCAPFRRSRRSRLRRVEAGGGARRLRPAAGDGLQAGQQVPAAARPPRCDDLAEAAAEA